MRRLHSLAALLLLALWLPATLHCDLEAAGIEGLFGCHEPAPAGQPHRSDDVSHAIEGATFRLDFGAVKAPPPAVTLHCLLCPALLSAPTLPTPPVTIGTGTAPPKAVRPWQFLTRAAPSPRAPSSAA